ncbi:MAG: TolC family protein [Archangiaceae bacterium]|nr:TolC family protein [Archangiaceae bacterium]
MSQADMVQAWLPKNPSLTTEVGINTATGGVSELLFTLVQQVLDLVVLPWRKEAAEQQFDAEVLELAHQALATVAASDIAVAEYQAAQQALELERAEVDATEATALFAELQYEAKNISALALARARTDGQRARLQLARAELNAKERREALNRLLGLSGAQLQWTLAGPLTALPASEPDGAALEDLAVRDRLDLAAARGRGKVLEKAAALARNSRVLGFVNVGVDYHRFPDGTRVIGLAGARAADLRPTAGHHRATRGAAARPSAASTSSPSTPARTCGWPSPRSAAARRVAVQYRDVLVPLQEQAFEQSQLQYNGMLIGAPQLLVAERELLQTRRALVEAQRDYWVARATLEQKLGSRLP